MKWPESKNLRDYDEVLNRRDYYIRQGPKGDKNLGELNLIKDLGESVEELREEVKELRQFINDNKGGIQQGQADHAKYLRRSEHERQKDRQRKIRNGEYEYL